MESIGIIQPGRIGDIVICLPIAKHYHDMGYKVIWPISNNLINHFKDYVDYVEFVPVTTDVWKCIWETRQALQDCSKILELAFSYPGTGETTRIFDSSNIPFDIMKYGFANVPFEKKWTLDITRNKEREDELYNRVITNPKYVLCHFEGSGFKREVPLENVGNFDIIKIENLTDSIFDWLKVIEEARKLIMVDSCFANLVEQMNIETEKFFLKRSPYKITPTLKNNWKVV